MLVSIEGLYKPLLLLNLYNAATCSEERCDNPKYKQSLRHSTATLSKASTALTCHAEPGSNQLFEYVDLGDGLRPIRLRLLDDDNLVDVRGYDQYHGKGAALKVIEATRAQQKVQKTVAAPASAAQASVSFSYWQKFEQKREKDLKQALGMDLSKYGLSGISGLQLGTGRGKRKLP